MFSTSQANVMHACMLFVQYYMWCNHWTHYQIQDLLLEYGLENVAETLIEGLSRVKKCTDEGRALMSLDLQVFIPWHLLMVSDKKKKDIY